MSDTAATIQEPTTQANANAGGDADNTQAQALTENAGGDAGGKDSGDSMLRTMLGQEHEDKPDGGKTNNTPADKAVIKPAEAAITDAETIAHRTVLARLGWDAEDILALTPDKLKAKAEKYGQHVSRTDAAFKAAKELDKARKELDELRAKNAPDPLKAFKAKYGDLIDEGDLAELAGLVGKAPKIESDAKPKQDKQDKEGNGEESPALYAARQRLATVLVAEQRQALKGEFPQLADDAKAAAVYNAFDLLDPDGETLDNPAAFAATFRQAALLAYGDTAKGKTREELLKRNRAARDGQPEVHGTNPSAKPVLTAEDVAAESARLFLNDPANAASRTAEMHKRINPWAS